MTREDTRLTSDMFTSLYAKGSFNSNNKQNEDQACETICTIHFLHVS